MAPKYMDRTEYGGSDDRYRAPDGTPRSLSTGERAHLLRREGIADSATPSHPDDPKELGQRVG